MRDLSNLVEDYYLNYYEKVHGSQWGENRLFSIRTLRDRSTIKVSIQIFWK